jgi:pimeloyl-ACP methyl ester carboxylesterase
MTTDEWRNAGYFAKLSGRSIFYRDTQESKPCLVLLHGFPTSSWDWNPMWEDLKPHFRLIAPDFLGYGFSDRPKRHNYRIAEQAELTVQLLKSLKITQCHVLSHDYGDTVAQELLARQRDKPHATLRIDSVCFLNGGLFPETHRPRPIQKLLLTPIGPILSRLYTRRQFGRSFSAVFGARTQPEESELDDYWKIVSNNGGKLVLHRLLQYIPERVANRRRWVDAVTESAIPLRVICGLSDPVSGAHMLIRYRELVPCPDIVELPGIGHYPQTEAPESVLSAFLQFHDALHKTVS